MLISYASFLGLVQFRLFIVSANFYRMQWFSILAIIASHLGCGGRKSQFQRVMYFV